MREIQTNKVFIIFLLSVAALSAACGSGPADGYKKLYGAVKSRNTDQIKARMSKKTLDFADMASKRNNTPIEKVLENGFTATTFADELPEIRDERIKDSMGAVEVWNAKDRRWEDLPFIMENGEWKLAIGDLFAGSYRSPGKGRSMREADAANKSAGGNIMPASPPNQTADEQQRKTPDANAK